MSDEAPKKTADHLSDTLAQLKEMRHYSKNNVETLTTEWMLFDDGALKKLKKADAIAGLMDQQSKLYDELESVIEDLEDVLEKLPPEPGE